MPLFMRKLAITAKAESTYNTDPVPTGVANALQVRNATLSPMEMDSEGRVLVRPFLGNDEDVVMGTYQMLEFEVELAGAGAAGTAPKYGPLHLGSSHAETVNAGTSVVYSLVSAAFGSATLYCNYDGTNFKLTGARGTVSYDFTSRKIPFAKFNFWGLYNAAADLVLPALTLTGWGLPIGVNKANTPTCTLHGFAGVVQSCFVDVANELVYRNLVNHESIQNVDRAPVGKIVMEMTSVTAKDWMTTIRSATTGALVLTHGTVAGNIVQIDAPKVQLIKPAFSEMDGIMMLSADMKFLPSGTNGNDELTFTVK